MHKLLIENEMDGFSVIEARDAYLTIKDIPSDLDEARKRVYRQIWQFERKNWLRGEGEGRNKKYFQTDLFKSYHFSTKRMIEREIIESKNSIDHFSVLLKECNTYKGELEVALGEVEECRSLKERFPELEPKLTPLLEKARDRSAFLLGKVNVLSNVLKTLTKERTSC
ncbi:hypothetical protein VII00023_03758 [Vibrio ichthyoenteri ATCC 700023]|uniref:Transcriptional regulator VspR n=2 Tax=Vibrio ichthyoenteri TaxID=142461 RepID=F9S864_9VIBR|nr:hypothetical protein VII00023_03758 [Vibrio ichthyoenteri ATCC 700023]